MINQKICLIGASAVGKTSLIRQFVDGIFSDKYLTTIGVKIDKKLVCTANGDVNFIVWDIEGTDKFCGFSPRYLNGASAYVVVLDQSRTTSVQDALDVYAMAKSSSDAPAFLALNKTDLTSQISEIQQQAIKDADFIDIIATSAKTGENVEQLFNSVALYLLKEKQ
jgi:small GTP-binding protein